MWITNRGIDNRRASYGAHVGVLASFNDISELERMNEGLRDTLKNLETAHEEVRNKNEELFRLATIDPLTECFS